ncbi:hypothetical protein [Dongia sp.]|uniref:hypothetical protein n=1 Tax=Dongia sp. TaxID=1977262 RepID=UPI0035B3DDC3
MSCPRTPMALLAATLLAGCATAKVDTSGYAADLELALTKHMDFTQPAEVAAADWPAVKACAIPAMVSAIPPMDQRVLTMALNGQYADGRADNAFGKYFWFSPYSGQIDMNAKAFLFDNALHLHFEDGNFIERPDMSIRQRMRDDFERRCPDLARAYPGILAPLWIENDI